jgi:hypothetical protein
MSNGMKLAAGAAVAGLAGFAIGEVIEHEKDEDREQDRRLERLEREEDMDRYRDDYGGGGYGGGGYGGGGYGGGNTTVIEEDRGWFGNDRETIVQSGNLVESTLALLPYIVLKDVIDLQMAMAIPLSLKRRMVGSMTLKLSPKLIVMGTLLLWKITAGFKALISIFFLKIHIYSLFSGTVK